MATNKFANMLHRNTHKIIVILVYAVLEWILISLLLLNSLFSYLIKKYTHFFGLKPPCLWCSRVDHIFEPKPEPGRNANCYRDLVCDTHATEISKLCYCSTHHKLAEPENMCENCLASRPSSRDSYVGRTQRITFISWLSENHVENGEKIFRCSCCDERLGCKLYPPFWLLKPSWGALNYTQKDNLVIEAVDDDSNEGKFEIHRDNGEEDHDGDDEGITDEIQIHSAVNLQCDEKEADEGEKESAINTMEHGTNGTSSVHRSCDSSMIQCCPGQDYSVEIINLHFENATACEFNRLIPIELIDSSTAANKGLCNLKEDLREHDHQNGVSDSEPWIETQLNVSREVVALLTIDESTEEATEDQLESLEIAKGVIEVVEGKQDMVGEGCRQVDLTEGAPTLSLKVEKLAMKEQDDPPAVCGKETDCLNLLSDQSSAKTLISTEVSDHAADPPQAEEQISSLACLQDQSSTNDDGVEISTAVAIPQNDLGLKPMEKATLQEKTILAEKTQEGINHHSTLYSEPNEVEEDKFPDTPTSVDSLHYLHKKLILFEKRELGAEESLDGSVVSEMEGGDAVTTVERLKSALKSERKALSALYTELEEERSASAIAANQTMAMITRLQEEKAAMQMEGLQYQRMMEEQAEYDQEALQLMNELMTKREKEKQELEKELEIYRKKVLDYEAKEKIRTMRRIKDGSVRSRTSSVSFSNAEDSDELSIDLNREVRDEDSSYYGHQDSSQNNSPDNEVINLEEMALDCVKHMGALDESLAEFEEERLSILDQLKALEEKLITIGDNEGLLEDGNSIEHTSMFGIQELEEKHEFTSPEENGISDGFPKDKHFPDRKTMSSMAKSLLPLLDATDNENEELLYEEKGESEYIDMESSLLSTFELDGKKLDIEDEVDHVYERLQALEADREFLKHCMSSIKKGDKGVDLLEEILQHLRDLKAVEIRVKNMSDDPLM